MVDAFFILSHKVSQCLIYDRLISVVLIEDELGKVSVVGQKVVELELNVVLAILDGILGPRNVLRPTLVGGIGVGLDELSELSHDVSSHNLLCCLGNLYHSA